MLNFKKIIFLYFLIVPLLLGLTFFNFQNGKSDLWDIVGSIVLSTLVILDVLRVQKWKNMEKNSSRDKKITATAILALLLAELLIFLGFKILIWCPVGILFALIFYFKFSELFLSKAFENGGLLWRE